MYFGGGMWQAAKTFEPLLGALPVERLAQARRLMWTPYFVGSLTLACAAFFHNSEDSFLPIALAEGFGATSLLLFLPSVVEKPKRTPSENVFILSKNYCWSAAGATVFLIFVFLLGHGMNF